MSIMQPKLKSKVRCSDSEVGEVRRVIMDPLSHEVSHIVVGGVGAGSVERQVPDGTGSGSHGRCGDAPLFFGGVLGIAGI